MRPARLAACALLPARLAASALLAVVASALYAPTSLLAVRVGDGVHCPSANASCSAAAPLFLDEYNFVTGALVSTQAITGATLSATDNHVGALGRSADGASVAFGAYAAAAGTAPIILAIPALLMNFEGNRVIARVNSSGLVDTSTQLSAADYDGTIKGVCSIDGNGFWVAGNATNTCISYVAFGSNAGSSNVVNVAHDANCNIPFPFGSTFVSNMNGLYTGCTAVGGPNALYFTRALGLAQPAAFVDVPTSRTQSPLWTTADSFNINGVTTGVQLWESEGLKFLYSLIIVNRAQSQFWVVLPYTMAIGFGINAAPVLLPVIKAGTLGYLVNTNAVPSGMALSPDETKLYYSAGAMIFWVLSTFAANGMSMASGGRFSKLQPNILVKLSAPFFEFRGIALAPQTCSSPGYYCSGGLPALPCEAGSFCAGLGASLAPCASGVYCPSVATSNTVPCPAGLACPGNGLSPTICLAGTYSPGGTTASTCLPCSTGIRCLTAATNNSVVCPAGFACPSGTAPFACAAGSYSDASSGTCTLCSAGVFCASAATNNTVACPAGIACAGAGAAPIACGSGSFSAQSSTSCTACPASSYSFSASSICICLPGFVSNGLLGTSLVCSPCPSGTYNLGGAAACSSCPPTAMFVSSSQGCDPLLGSSSGALTGFSFSGASGEGTAAFAVVSGASGLSNVPSVFGVALGALSISGGLHLSSAPIAAAPLTLPSGNGPMTASAWVKCPLPTSGQASVLEWGLPGPVGVDSKFSLMVGPAGVNGSVGSVFADTGGQLSVLICAAGAGDVDNAVAASGAIRNPFGVTVDRLTQDIYICENTGKIRVLNASTGGLQTLIKGLYTITTPVPLFSLTFDSKNTGYLSASGYGAVFSFNRATGNMSVLAGSISALGTTDGIGADARFGPMYRALLDSTETFLYVCDGVNGKIRSIEIATGVVTTFLGGGASGTEIGATDGIGSNALFNGPSAAVYDTHGNMWVADGEIFHSSGAAIRKVELATLRVTTLAGNSLVAGFADGVGTNARFGYYITDIVIEPSSLYLYVVDPSASLVRKISTVTGTVTTLTPASASYSANMGLAIDATGSIISVALYTSSMIKITQAPLLPACGDGSWHHIALTQGDGGASTRKTYLDGVLVSTVTSQLYSIPTTGTTAAPLSLRIGSNGLGGDLYSGLVSDLRIYNRALPASEIAALMQPPTFTIPPAPPAVPASPVGAIVAIVLVLLVAAAAVRVRSERERRRRVLKAEAAATPAFAIDFAAGEIMAANPLNASGRQTAGGNVPPSSSVAASGAQVNEIAWSDLVPDLSFAPMFGGFGIVFVARWVSKKKLVAVKVPKLAALTPDQSRAAVQMLLAEAQGLMRASDGGINEHVVQVFGVAQGKAEGWQAALLVSKEAEARKAARKAKTEEHKSKRLGFSAAGTWEGKESAVGSSGAAPASSAVATAMSEASEGESAAALAPVKDENEEDEDEDAAEGHAAAAAKATAKLAEDAAAAGGERKPAPFLFGLVMSFEAGGSLDTKLFPRRAGRASWPSKMVDRLRVLKEAAAGLYGLHAVGMVHGDLKPENVLLSGKADSPHVRLADFGLATIKGSAERASRISVIAHADEKRGTWPYMAPEMYRSKAAPPAAASRSTDVYAFGTLMHEVLATRVPWQGFSETDRLAALREGENLDMAALPKDTPPGVAALVARCLALDRADRPRTAEVLAALEQAHENIVSGHFVRRMRMRTRERVRERVRERASESERAAFPLATLTTAPSLSLHRPPARLLARFSACLRTSSSRTPGARARRASRSQTSCTSPCARRAFASGRTTSRWATTWPYP